MELPTHKFKARSPYKCSVTTVSLARYDKVNIAHIMRDVSLTMHLTVYHEFWSFRLF